MIFLIPKSGLRDLGLQLLCEELYRAGAASQLQVLACRGNQVALVEERCVGALSLLLASAECRLSELLLGGNRLRDEGAMKLADIITASRSLLHLDVGSNSITSKGLCALARAVSHHTTLQEMELWGNRDAYETRVYMLPKQLDEEVARLHLAQLGVQLTELSQEQADYIDVPVEGPYKPDYYRY